MTSREHEASWRRAADEIRSRLGDLDYLRELGQSNAYPVAYFVLLDEVARLRAIASQSQRGEQVEIVPPPDQSALVLRLGE